METILLGDALERLRELPDESLNCCVTSPPYYGLRDYGTDGQIGMEETPEEYIDKLTLVFREVRRTMKPDGTLWLNVGDSYAGSWHGRNADGSASSINENKGNAGSRTGTVKKKADVYKPKDLIGIPWMLAFALRADGCYLRQDIIWEKPNAMPESVKDRCTKSHEYIFLLSKSGAYYFDNQAIMEPRSGNKNDAVAGSRGAFGPQQSRLRGSGNRSIGQRLEQSTWAETCCIAAEIPCATSVMFGVSQREGVKAHTSPCSRRSWRSLAYWPEARRAAQSWTRSWGAEQRASWQSACIGTL